MWLINKTRVNKTCLVIKLTWLLDVQCIDRLFSLMIRNWKPIIKQYELWCNENVKRLDKLTSMRITCCVYVCICIYFSFSCTENVATHILASIIYWRKKWKQIFVIGDRDKNQCILNVIFNRCTRVMVYKSYDWTNEYYLN